MPTYEQAMEALKRADAAGNVEDARALAKIAQSLKGQQAPLNTIPTADNPAFAKPEPQAEPGFFDKVKGAGETALAVGSQALLAPVGIAQGVFEGGKAALQGGSFQEAASKAYDRTASLGYQPKTESGQAQTEAVGNVMQSLPPVVPEIPRVSAPLANAGSKAATAIGETAGKVGKVASEAVTFKISPQTLALAKKAESYGIPLRPDMLGNNKIMQMVGEALEKVPLSGSKAESRRTAFNQAVMKTIGADPKATKLTPDVFDKAITKSGETIGDISAKYAIPVDKEFSDALTTSIENAAKFETADVAKVVTNYIDEIKSKSVDGVIDGKAFRKLNSAISKKAASTTNGDLKNALGDVLDAMHDALDKTASGVDKATLMDARRKYAYAKAIEPLVAKSPEGDISPAGLMGAVTANKQSKSYMARGKGGDLGDVAKIGQRFVKEPGSSGTAERQLAYGLLGGGLAVNAPLAAGAYTLANMYNRAGAKVSKAITKAKTLKDAE